MTLNFSTTKEIEKFLNTIPKFSSAGNSASNFDLSRMNRFCAEMGHPEKKFKSIHVAGTNGKGTVCRMFASVYRSAGYKTALYTSPHLLRFQERFKVDGYEITDEQLLEFFRQYGGQIKEKQYTFFEITTAIAYWYFAKEEVDIAIIETGLGGRLDATNVIDSELSVITSIGFDHTDILGNTLPEIAYEKAGIIKKNKSVIFGKLYKEAEDVICDVAEKNNSHIKRAEDLNPKISDETIHLCSGGEELFISYFGKEVDAVNAAIVLQGVKQLMDNLPVSNEQFAQGIENLKVNYPLHASFQQLKPDSHWYFDGAHNADATKLLIKHMLSIAPAEEWTVILSYMKDKLSPDIGEFWADFPNLFVCEMEGERAAKLTEMQALFPHAKYLDISKKQATNLFETELVIFSGSFYFYKAVSNWMGTETNSL
ncbi:MAG: hypothetical protein EA391_04575 [Balneolaceae bacterium]|nr:MAG: hypothetical protein EA391_04575 [Balneolaceae bacterium]